MKTIIRLMVFFMVLMAIALAGMAVRIEQLQGQLDLYQQLVLNLYGKDGG